MYDTRPNVPEWVHAHFRLKNDLTGEKTRGFLKDMRNFGWELWKVSDGNTQNVTLAEVLYALRHVHDEFAYAVAAFATHWWRIPVTAEHVLAVRKLTQQ